MIWQKIIKSELIKNTSVLVSGTIIAQLIPILLQPVLRRFYSPDAFGSLAVYISLMSILIVVASFKYELAIVLPRKDKEAVNIVFVSVLLNLVFNVILFFIILIFKQRIVRFLNISTEFQNYIYFVPLGTFLFSFYQSLNHWLIRRGKFVAISKNKFIRRGSEGITQVSFQFLNKTFGLIIGDIIGHIANVISGIYFSVKSGLKLSLISIVKVKYILRKYIEYPKFNVIPSLMSACSYLFPTLIINKYYSPQITGYFDLSKQMLSIPLALVAISLSNVLLKTISDKFKAKSSFKNALYPIFIMVLGIAFVEIVVIKIWGEQLFSIVFGHDWKFSGTISEILVWSYAFNFLTASFSSVFLAMKKIKLLSAWQFIYFISILILLLFKSKEFTEFLQIYVFIEVICYFILAVLIIRIISNYERKIKV